MFVRRVSSILDLTAAREADRLIRSCGIGALQMARHAVRAAHEGNRNGFWTRVLAQVELRSSYRPW